MSLYKTNSKTKSLLPGFISTNDVNSILNSGNFTDVEIKCGSEILHAHSNTLSTKSPVFERALSKSTAKDNEKHTIVVNDLDPDILRSMLVFMYREELEDLKVPVACSLAFAARRYGLKKLQKYCVNYLDSRLSFGYALEILKSAYFCNEVGLKEKALVFIVERFHVFKGTQEWKDFQFEYAITAMDVLDRVKTAKEANLI